MDRRGTGGNLDKGKSLRINHWGVGGVGTITLFIGVGRWQQGKAAAGIIA
jgi:hypothetical protein